MTLLKVEITLSPVVYESIFFSDSESPCDESTSLAASQSCARHLGSERQIEIVLAENVAKLRAQQDITKRQLSSLCGLHRNELCRIEDASVSISLHTLEKLARGLKIHPSELIR